MWTYLPQWLVQDGQVEELAPGSMLMATAVAANCTNVSIADKFPSNAIVRTDAGAGHYVYDVTGLAGAVHDVVVGDGAGQTRRHGSEFLLTSGSFEFIARTTGIFVHELAGSMVSARCSFEVMADYEAAAFDLPDVRADWAVNSVRIQRRSLEHIMVVGPNGKLGRDSYAGDVVEVVEVPRIRKWADDPLVTPELVPQRTVMDYLIDLTPIWPTA